MTERLEVRRLTVSGACRPVVFMPTPNVGVGQELIQASARRCSDRGAGQKSVKVYATFEGWSPEYAGIV